MATNTDTNKLIKFNNNFDKIINQFAKSRTKREIFADFIRLQTIALANHNGQNEEKFEARKKEFIKTMQSYSDADKTHFQELYVALTHALEEEVHDYLGYYMTFGGMTDKGRDQYFTPEHIASLMSGITMESKEEIEAFMAENNGYYVAMDPTSGTGGLLLAFVPHFVKMGFNPQSQLIIRASDLSSQVLQAAFIQFQTLGIKGKFSVRNAIEDSDTPDIDTFYSANAKELIWRYVNHFVEGGA